MLGIVYIFQTNVQLSIIVGVPFLILQFFMIKLYRRQSKKYSERVNSLTYTINEVGSDIFDNLPIGILTYNQSELVVWVNDYLKQIVGDGIEGSNIDEFFPGLIQAINNKEDYHLVIEDKNFNFLINEKSSIIYLFDNTAYWDLKQDHIDQGSCLGILTIDNYDESVSNLDAQSRSEVEYSVSQYVSNWCVNNKIYVRRYTSSKYILLLNNRTLDILTSNNFILMDKVREIGEEKKINVTVSLGIATNETDYVKLGERAVEAIDLAQVRGGDQVVIKSKDEETRFYGGKTDAVEKATRVKARMIAQSIEKLIDNSGNIVVMGHANPDHDSFASSIAVARMAKDLGKEVYVHIDKKDLSNSMQKVYEFFKSSDLFKLLKSEEFILSEITEKTILICVDNHKPRLVSSKAILEKCKNTIVLDHHRRGEEFVSNPILTYVEPYASSTSELVTELITYQRHISEMTPDEATLLLLGIIVDTKHFTYRTGGRTFDAASWLKAMGADTITAKELLKVDKDTYFGVNKIVKNAKVITDVFVIASADFDDVVSTVTLAKVADELLSVDGFEVTFAIGKLNDGRIGVSARSLGEVNVQAIMEKMEGGGHLTNAATQLENVSLDEVYNRIIVLMEKRLEESEQSESNIN
jgi:c-di-AMP phosphodiesterase-like protein